MRTSFPARALARLSKGAAVLLVGLFSLVLPQLVFAQAQNTGTIAGKVFDDSHSAIRGATLKLTSEGQGKVYTATSNDQGEYTFNDIPAGPYTLQATAEGFLHLRDA